MPDELLQYYHRELSYLRRSGKQFAERHPDVAARLRLEDEQCDDPHVERLLEAFAYLAARIHRKIDDDFPLISEALLNVLYPHFTAPTPSMAVAQIHLDPSHDGAYIVPRETMLETDPIVGSVPCRFRTCYPVTLWPINVSDASMGPIELSLPQFVPPPGSMAMIRVRLAAFTEDITFSTLGISQLRFFLSGQKQHANELYELLLNHATGIAVFDTISRKPPRMLDTGAIQPVGFGRDEAALPDYGRQFPGYRLLAEYFAFPEKFLFIDVRGLDEPERAEPGSNAATESILTDFGSEMELLIFLDQTAADLQQNVGPSMFRLGCTPIVNLFKQKADPIELTQTALSYRVVPDARRPRSSEVFSIDRVVATNRRQQSTEYHPFFAIRHTSLAEDRSHYWYATRQETDDSPDGNAKTEVDVAFVDLDFNPAIPPDSVIDLELTCLNGDLPSKLPFGGGQPRIRLRTGGPIKQVECLTAPTKTYRRRPGGGLMWRIISHLTMNHLTLTGGEDAASSLREMLKLYDVVDSAESRAKLKSILSVESRRSTFRAPNDLPGTFCRGVEINVTFDNERFSDHGLFLFATVLEQALGWYCSINSAVQFVARVKNQQEDALKRWPPRAGEKTLL